MLPAIKEVLKGCWARLSFTLKKGWGIFWEKIGRRFRWVFLFLVAWFLLHTIVIVADGLTDEVAPADVAVILGAQVYADGSPSLSLQARLEKGIELYQAKIVPKLLVSGDDGEKSFHETIMMREYLLSHGVPDADILVDPAGVNTYATALNTARITKEEGFKSVLIISQYFHIARIKLAFKKAGLPHVFSAHAPLFIRRDFYSIPREFVGYYVYLFYPRMDF